MLARRGMSAYLPIIIATIITFCGVSWQIFWTTTDAARYQCYALTFWLGSNATKLLPLSQCLFLHTSGMQAPFHMLPLEYPPLTLLPFSLALLAPLPYYQVVFALLMALTSVLIYWLLLRYGPRGAGLVFALYLLAGAWATAETRFDLLPAALTLLCIVAAEHKHWTFAYIALAFGVLLKLYPILLFPALFIAEQRFAHCLYSPSRNMTLKTLPGEVWRTLRGTRQWRWKNSFVFLSIVSGVTGAFALLNFRGAIVSQLSYFIGRPVQVEATSSTFLWLAAQFGFPAGVVYTYGSLNIVSALNGAVSFVGILAFIAGSLYAVYLQWSGRTDIVQTSIALLLVFVATGKVFSPQYLIWILPLLAYSGAFDSFWLLCWGAISVLTTYIYAYLYTRTTEPLLVPFVSGFTQTVSIRNMFFVLVTLAYLFNWFHVRRRKPRAALARRKETQPLLIVGIERNKNGTRP